ncbi:unnamed protein product [Psylliodes chrysocephalus]|uniref:Myrosinase 1-like n=1 Tax=Psylliodes chrysocephalus TaxID=3402493 RepID=A0A9P0CJT8_9CUCU|nr:unnamed protein product [Psylliodes chrysocephala]
MVVLNFLFLFFACANGLSDYPFPDNFSFGTGISAYQTEGAESESNKGETIWDYAIKQNASIIEDGTNAENADLTFYSYFDEDIDQMVKMNISHFKLSIAWSRIFPEGVFKDEIEVITGVGHYQTQIKKLLKNNITPIVTLYHWDLPEIIQEWGGWTNASNIDIFVDYARKIFPYLFNVNYFITFNEPKQICKSGYGDGTLAPFIKKSGVLDYQCAYNVLKAHAAVYRMYQKEFASKMNAKISIALDGSWSQPKTDSDADKKAAERRNHFEFGLYANPIINGDWPQEVIDRVKERSEKEKLKHSRLPAFTKEEKADIKGSIDFMALNYFDTRIVADSKEADYKTSSYANDMKVEISANPDWPVDAAGNTIVPSGLRSFLKYIKENYGDPEILITGNGFADDGTTHDGDRVTHLSNYLSNVVDAIHEDKVNVVGYTYWSLLDSFEWTKGYKPHYGLYSVNLSWDNVTRISKRSVKYYSLVILERKVVNPADLTSTTSTTSTTTSTSTESTEITSTSTESTEITSTSTEPSEVTTPARGDCIFMSTGVIMFALLLQLL